MNRLPQTVLLGALTLVCSAYADRTPENLRALQAAQVCAEPYGSVYFDGEQDKDFTDDVEQDLARIASLLEQPFTGQDRECSVRLWAVVDYFENQGKWYYQLNFEADLRQAVLSGLAAGKEAPVQPLKATFENAVIWNVGSYGYTDSKAELEDEARASFGRYFKLFIEDWRKSRP